MQMPMNRSVGHSIAGDSGALRTGREDPVLLAFGQVVLGHPSVLSADYSNVFD
jgi:hypothetical protein